MPPSYEPPAPFRWRNFTIETSAELQEVVLLILDIGNAIDAAELVDDYGRYLETLGNEDGRAVARSNIGYLAGYQDRETKNRIFDLFECEHPILGRSNPTAEEAFQKGVEWGEAMKAGKPYP